MMEAVVTTVLLNIVITGTEVVLSNSVISLKVLNPNIFRVKHRLNLTNPTYTV
jgi:hypothetical protein